MTVSISEQDHRIAKLAALAMIIHVLEAALPSPIPGIKPGLANIIILYVLATDGWKTAAWVSLLRVFGSGLLLGQWLSPTFMLSFSGALAALLVMLPCRPLLGRHLSLIGASVLAALAHVLAQFSVAAWLFLPHPSLWHVLPGFLGVAVVFGLLSGTMAHALVQRLNPSRP